MREQSFGRLCEDAEREDGERLEQHEWGRWLGRRDVDVVSTAGRELLGSGECGLGFRRCMHTVVCHGEFTCQRSKIWKRPEDLQHFAVDATEPSRLETGEWPQDTTSVRRGMKIAYVRHLQMKKARGGACRRDRLQDVEVILRYRKKAEKNERRGSAETCEHLEQQ